MHSYTVLHRLESFAKSGNYDGFPQDPPHLGLRPDNSSYGGRRDFSDHPQLSSIADWTAAAIKKMIDPWPPPSNHHIRVVCSKPL
jgi:hypothetical protein